MIWLLADAAEEGRNVITGMLIVGLIFVAVIALGLLTVALGVGNDFFDTGIDLVGSGGR